MKYGINGIHHITALASDPRANLDFYTGFLGLRLVKKTVNFDAPDVYHLYFGDETGRPGTLLTFFPFPGAPRGKRGTGEVTAVAFSIPTASLDFWMERLARQAIHFDGPARRFDEQVVSFEDPDGLLIELVTDPEAHAIPAWEGGSTEPAHSPRRLHGATVTLRSQEYSERFLFGTLRFMPTGSDGNRKRYMIGEGNDRSCLDLVEVPRGLPGRQSAGSVHHIAWRVESDETQLEWRTRLVSAGHDVTPVRDRNYFRSIYFREPGGVLFEIATDQPGFLIDEDREDLGKSLKLPPWLESDRRRLEKSLPPLALSVTGEKV